MSATDQIKALNPGSDPAPGGKSAKPKKGILQFELTKKKIPRKELMHFSRQLAVFIKAGIPIIDALEAIQEEMGNKFFRTIVEDVTDSLREGSTFADACARYESAFPSYYLGILRSAELTGRLDTVLVQLSEYIERDLDARRKVSSALAYPAVILVVAVIVIAVLVAFVLPRFAAFFESLDADLPLPTRILLGMSDFLTNYALVILASMIALIAVLVVTLRTQAGKTAKDTLVLRLPILGDLLQHVVLERFCRILSTMMQAGVPLPAALQTTSDASGNSVYRKGIADARAAMMRGEGLAGPLIATGLFPPSAKQMFRVGESTGTLDQQLETAALYFERELDYKMKRFTTLFEPAVLIFVGLIVGFVAVAVVSAMYGIFRQVRP